MNSRNENRHWLYWPFVFLIGQVLVYLFFLGSKGYFAYEELKNQKKILGDQISQLKSERQSLLARKNILKDNKKARDRFRQELYLYDSPKNTEIVKFKLESKTFTGAISDEYSLRFWQNVYFILGGFAQLLIVVFFIMRKKSAGFR